MVRISELELEWSLVQFELHLELGFFLIFELSNVWFFFQIILCTLDFECWLTADFDQVPHTWKIFFYTNGLSCVCEARFIGLASGVQRQTTCLQVRGCFLVLVCLCVVVWVLFSIFSIFSVYYVIWWLHSFATPRKNQETTQFATLETRREPVPQWFLGLLLETCRSSIGQFFSVPSNSPRSLCESDLGPVSRF